MIMLYLPSFSASTDSSLMLNGSPSCRSRRCPGTVLVVHDTLFIHQQQLENGYLVEYANDLGLDIPQFSKSCLNKCMSIASMKISKVGKSGMAAPVLFINNI